MSNLICSNDIFSTLPLEILVRILKCLSTIHSHLIFSSLCRRSRHLLLMPEFQRSFAEFVYQSGRPPKPDPIYGHLVFNHNPYAFSDLPAMRKLFLRSPVSYFAQVGHPMIVKALVQDGRFDVNHENGNPICLAARYGRLDTLRILVGYGADIHAQDDYPLKMAAWYGHFAVVSFLLQKGANVHAGRDHSLAMASCNGHIDIVRLLLKHGADAHADRSFALRLAVSTFHFDIAKILLEAGADAHVGNDLAMRMATMKRDYDMINYLVNFERRNSKQTNDNALSVATFSIATTSALVHTAPLAPASPTTPTTPTAHIMPGSPITPVSPTSPAVSFASTALASASTSTRSKTATRRSSFSWAMALFEPPRPQGNPSKSQ